MRVLFSFGRTFSVLGLWALTAAGAAGQVYQQYLSDKIWVSATNGRGPVERNRTNGAAGWGDGVALQLGETPFQKGLGVHAPSEIRYNLEGACSVLTAMAGVDRTAGAQGSVVFQVQADGETLFDSGLVKAGQEAKPVQIDLQGRQDLTLIVTDGGDGNDGDIASWADAQLTCERAGNPTEPIVIDNQDGVLISGVSITSDTGPCIVIKGNSSNIRIENSNLGPCLGGISIESAKNVEIDNVYIHDTAQQGNGIDVTFSEDVKLSHNRFERVRTGIYALRSTRVRVEYNEFLNVQGPLPRGQFVQFNRVYGAGNVVNCNRGENVVGESDVVEAINLYDSFGEPNDPIQVVGNRIQGGGPSESSGAILLGDGGGSYQIARDNVIAEPGQQGIGIAGGNNITAQFNLVHARTQPFTNVGIYVWNQHDAPCFNITVEGNEISWLNRNGERNPAWDAGNCGTVSGWDTNKFNATIDMDQLAKVPQVCDTTPRTEAVRSRRISRRP